MKRKSNNRIQLIVLFALGLAVILSLVIPQRPRPQRYEDTPEISVIIREPENGGWFNTRQGMEQAAGDLGADLRFLPLTEANNGPEQDYLIRREAQGGADVFVIVPADPENLDRRLAELTDGGVTVALESPMSSANNVITVEKREMGQALALDLVENWDGGRVLLIDSSPLCRAVQERLEGARAVLEEHHIPVTVEKCPSELLPERLPRECSRTAAHYVMTFEHSATEKAAQARETTGMTGAVYGVGASGSIVTYLERGALEAVAAWSDYAVGYLTVAQAVGVYNGAVSWHGKGVDFRIVHREEIYDSDIQKLLFPVGS